MYKQYADCKRYSQAVDRSALPRLEGISEAGLNLPSSDSSKKRVMGSHVGALVTENQLEHFQ